MTGKQAKGKGKGGRKAAGRAKGTGGLERHGRTWRAVWVVDGVRHVRSTGTSDRDTAEKKLAEIIKPYLADIEAAQAAKAAKAAKRSGMEEAAKALTETAKTKRAEAGRLSITIKKAWGKFNSSLARGSISESTARTYAGRWEAFETWMEQNRPNVESLADVDEETAQEFMQSIKAKFSPKTFNEYRALLFMVWKTLDGAAGLEGFNPWSKERIKPLPKETHVRRELTVEEMAGVVAPLDGEMRTLFAIGIYTGLRLGDAVTLDWGNVDLVRGFIQCKPHKTKQHGTTVKIPLFPALAAILAETPAKKRRGRILPELAEEYARHPQYTARRVQRVFTDAGITTQSEEAGRNRKAVDVGFHSLRHGFVSLCANGGVPLSVVQAIVGHTNAAMTQHYFHVSDDALRGAVKVLPDVFGKKALPSGDVIDVEARDVPEKARPALPPSADAGDVLRRVLEGLQAMTAKDWKRVRDELAEMVKNAMGTEE